MGIIYGGRQCLKNVVRVLCQPWLTRILAPAQVLCLLCRRRPIGGVSGIADIVIIVPYVGKILARVKHGLVDHSELERDGVCLMK